MKYEHITITKKNKYTQRFQLTKHTCFWMYAAGGPFDLVASCCTCDGSAFKVTIYKRMDYTEGLIPTRDNSWRDQEINGFRSEYLTSFIYYVCKIQRDWIYIRSALIMNMPCVGGTLERTRNFRKEHPDYFISIVIFFDHLVYICYTSH